MNEHRMPDRQRDLFDAPSAMPDGFTYEPNFLTPGEECRLLNWFAALPFREFEFHGFLGKRRTVSFGWKYDFGQEGLKKAEDFPELLTSVRRKAADLARLPAPCLEQAVVSEYAPGAGIGWHRDRPIFGDVIAISLASSCTFRLRRKSGAAWQR